MYLADLLRMQVVDTGFYAARAVNVAEREVDIPVQRGRIFDRNRDVPLVTNKPSFALDITPANTGSLGVTKVLSRIAAVLKVPVASLARHLAGNTKGPYAAVEVESGVPFRTISYLAEHIDRYPGLSWQSKPVRDYKRVGSLSHVIGYVGEIDPRELQLLYNLGYTANSTIGKSGVEKQYDSLLRGKDGRQFRIVDAHGRVIRDLHSHDVAPRNGDDLVLTVDRHIQELAAKALGNRTGSVIVLKPHTGEILAMVSYPWFDADKFEGPGATAAIQSATDDPKYPFLNRAIQSSYAPASTFKIIMTTADYATNAFPPDKTIDTTGSMYYGGRVWHDWQHGGFGPIDLPHALAMSSDQYFWTLGTQYLGIDNIVKFASVFGLGQKSGIDIPGEVSGLLPTPAWKSSKLGSEWVGGDTMNVSIGQGFLRVTPIQMADVAAMVVNGGTVYRPHVLKEVRDPTTGALIERIKPKVLRTSDLDPSVFTKVRAAMRGVITFGTANVVITTDAVNIAAKTGTGQVGLKDHFTSWFVSYGPYKPSNPDDQVVVVVMVEANNAWEWWAPKAATIIYQGIFDHQSYKQAVKALEPVWYLNPQVLGNFND